MPECIAEFGREVETDEEEEATAGAFDAEDAGAVVVVLLPAAPPEAVDPGFETAGVEPDALLPGAAEELAPALAEEDEHVPPG